MDIHNFEKRYESGREKFLETEGIGKSSKELVEEFLNDYGTKENLSIKRKTKYYRFFRMLYHKGFLSVDLDKITKKDVIECLRKISESDYAESTKKDYGQRLPKTFYRWYKDAYKKELSDEAKEAIEYWLDYNYKKNHNKVDDKQALTLDEIEKLVKACRSTRDRALVMTMVESGARVGELLNVRLNDLDTENWKNGYIMKINQSKTKKREIPLYKSVPYLAEWLGDHPYKDNPGNENAYLWIMQGDRPMSYAAVRKVLRVLKDRANLKKPLTPHIMRHTAATLAGNEGWNEYQMQDFFGWSRRSDVAGQYVHKIDLKKVVEEKNGIRAEEDEKADKRLEPKKCAVCEEVNPATNEYCIRCFRPLDSEKIHGEFDKLADEISQDKDKIRTLLQFVSNLELEKLEKLGEKYGKEAVEEAIADKT